MARRHKVTQTSEAKSSPASEPHYPRMVFPALQKIRKETWSESEDQCEDLFERELGPEGH